MEEFGLKLFKNKELPSGTLGWYNAAVQEMNSRAKTVWEIASSVVDNGGASSSGVGAGSTDNGSEEGWTSEDELMEKAKRAMVGL